MPFPFYSYLVRLGASLVAVFAAVWIYAALAPMAFMEGGYPVWIAKERMLAECSLGRIAFFGDSRVEAGIIPALLPVPAANFAVAAGTAVEMRSAVRRAGACAERPAQAVVSLSPEHFGPLSIYFWNLSVRYGFLSPGEVWETEQLAARLGDTQSFSTRTPDGFSGRLRDWLYALRFPPFSFSSLATAHLFGRLSSNQARLAGALATRGWSEYAGDGHRGAEPAAFTETKLQLAEFADTLDRLQRGGVPVRLLVMPSPQSDTRDQSSTDAYLAMLAGFTQGAADIKLVNNAIPLWPDRLFADGVHLNAEGAKLFSQRLAACMPTGSLEAPCDLAWHDPVSALSVLQVHQ